MTAAEARVRGIWERVVRWARRRSRKPLRYTLRFDCALILRNASQSPRAYMHTLHLPGKICCASDVAALPVPNIVGLLLHEIGHPLASELYGRSEQEDADRAVREVLGIRIKYKGALLLEWVSPPVVKRILEA